MIRLLTYLHLEYTYGLKSFTVQHINHDESEITSQNIEGFLTQREQFQTNILQNLALSPKYIMPHKVYTTYAKGRDNCDRINESTWQDSAKSTSLASVTLPGIA